MVETTIVSVAWKDWKKKKTNSSAVHTCVCCEPEKCGHNEES